MKKSVGKIKASIYDLELRLRNIQEKCAHARVEKKHGASTGNYDPSDDRYWTDFHCLECDKRWHETGSK
jgi:hypothetical protein